MPIKLYRNHTSARQLEFWNTWQLKCRPCTCFACISLFLWFSAWRALCCVSDWGIGDARRPSAGFATGNSSNWAVITRLAGRVATVSSTTGLQRCVSLFDRQIWLEAVVSLSDFILFQDGGYDREMTEQYDGGNQPIRYCFRGLFIRICKPLAGCDSIVMIYYKNRM